MKNIDIKNENNKKLLINLKLLMNINNDAQQLCDNLENQIKKIIDNKNEQFEEQMQLLKIEDEFLEKKFAKSIINRNLLDNQNELRRYSNFNLNDLEVLEKIKQNKNKINVLIKQKKFLIFEELDNDETMQNLRNHLDTAILNRKKSNNNIIEFINENNNFCNSIEKEGNTFFKINGEELDGLIKNINNNKNSKKTFLENKNFNNNSKHSLDYLFFLN